MIEKRIIQLRKEYETEKNTLAQNHKKNIAALNKKVADIQAKDYYLPYIDKYRAFESAMNAFCTKIAEIEKDTHGLSFYSKQYLPKAAPLPLDGRNVEQTFEWIVTQSESTVRALESSGKAEEYQALIRTFCDLFATMKYIAKDSTALLKKSGIPDAEKQRDLDSVASEIDKANKDYEFASKLENLACYAGIHEMQTELREAYEKSSRELLGNTPLGDDEQYTYLVGYRIREMRQFTAQDIAFCENILQASYESIQREPVYIKACTHRCNLIINAPYEFLASHDCYELIRNVYFSVASRVDKNMLQFGCIECTDNRAIIRSIYTGINAGGEKKRFGSDGVFTYGDMNVNKAAKVAPTLAKINENCCDSLDNFENLVEFNLKTEKNKQPLKMVAVNLYPAGFGANHREEPPFVKLKQLMHEFWDSGTFFVVCQDTSNPALISDNARLDPEECNAVEITLSDSDYQAWKSSGKALKQCKFSINGAPAVMDIEAPEFDGEAYWETLKRYYTTKKVFALKSVFQKIAQMQPSSRSLFDEGALEIPVGLRGSELYSLRYPLTSKAHTLIYGGSGSGKSSFLHTFILSLCYKYSPEDVQIYLADFKLNLQNFYAVNKLPHIKYLLMKNGVTEVKDTFTMIEQIRKERQSMIAKYNCGDIVGYNKMAARCTDGSMQKLPFLLFIIDEYQVIQEVTGANGRDMQAISSTISTIFSQARSAGIALFLCGQNFSDAGNFDAGNISTYIVMGQQLDNQRLLQKYFLNNDYTQDLTSFNDFLSIPDEGRCLIKFSNAAGADKVRFAYAGADESRQREAYVKEIRSLSAKDGDQQLLTVFGGSEEPIRVTENSLYHKLLEDEAETSYNLEIGIGSTTGRAIHMDFANEEEHQGWVVCAAKFASMVNITRNTILSFLFKTAQFNGKYSSRPFSKKVYYWGEKSAYKSILGSDFFPDGAHAVIDSSVNAEFRSDNPYHIYEQIIAFGDELKRRKNEMGAQGIRFFHKAEYLPYLLIIQSTEWLGKKEMQTIISEHHSKAAKEKAASAAAASAAASSSPLGEDSVQGLPPELAKKLSSFGKVMAARQMRPPEGSDPKVDVTPEAVFEAIQEIFQNGNKHGIFMLIATEKYSNLSGIFGQQYSRMEDNSHTVFGSYAEYAKDAGSNNFDNQDQSMICYVGDQGIKTRLYDYNTSTESEWWNRFQNL